MTIFMDISILYKKKSVDNDIYKDTNILLGSLVFSDGSFLFNDDYSYSIHYKNTNDYCGGKYKYNYGGSNNGIIINEDDNYFYYDLFLYKEYCYTENSKINKNTEEKLIVGINKKDFNDLVFIDSENNYAYGLKRN